MNLIAGGGVLHGFNLPYEPGFICAKSTPSEVDVRKLFMLSETLVIILGVVLIVEGIPWFMSPRGTKRMLSELFQMNDQALRSIGLGFMLVGLFLVYLAKT